MNKSKSAFLVVAFFIVASISGCSLILSGPEYGGEFSGNRAERMKQSPQYKDGHFENTPPQQGSSLMTSLKEYFGDQVRTPPGPFPIEKPVFSSKPEEGLRAYWFGHAAVLIEIDGLRIMSDPMLSEYAFPIQMFAPKRYNPTPVDLEGLPPIDAVVISHDHYDHLDMKTIQYLSKKGTKFFVGLGIGAHLEAWDVPADSIYELDWWESKTLNGITIHCTPARHYSGRRAMDNSTLWASWLIKGTKHTVYHSGDSGYAPHFKEIGNRLGPIDVAFIKIGDYGNDPGWEDIHMVPENSIKAHLDLGAKEFFPIHWGAFELSFHAWDEPIKRAVKAAQESQVDMVIPALGQTYTYGAAFENRPWWQDVVAAKPAA